MGQAKAVGPTSIEGSFSSVVFRQHCYAADAVLQGGAKQLHSDHRESKRCQRFHKLRRIFSVRNLLRNFKVKESLKSVSISRSYGQQQAI